MRRSHLSFSLFTILLTALMAAGCASATKDLREGEKAYQSAHYEDAIIWFEAIEGDVPKLSADDRVRYHYYRGMSAYRLSDRDEALYHLALARELAAHERGALDSSAEAEIKNLLDELTPKGATYRVDSGDEVPSVQPEAGAAAQDAGKEADEGASEPAAQGASGS